MADRDLILAPPTSRITVSIALEPVYNALNSLMLVASPEWRSGFGEWVMKTAAELPPDLARTHWVVFEAFFAAIEPEQNWPSFADYVDDLAMQDAAAMRDRAIGWMGRKELEGISVPDLNTLVNDKAAFLGVIEAIYAKKHNEKDPLYDFEANKQRYADAHDLLQDPPALKALIVNHLRTMWNDWFAPEWARVLPMLQESVEAFRQLDYSRMTALEAVRTVTGRDFTGIWEEWANQLIFVPSAHIGPYVTRFDGEGVTRLIFGARQPEGARVSSPSLSRSELLVRLSALADDTRLQILELLTQHDELCAQDVIEMLNLSQSAASRHLRQLTATGYLIERRREVAKCYSLNPRRVDDTLHALKRFLRK
ncbi:MAG: winged helix-turn-helix transcriptional regulator [Chloroflexi bacterium]|nr:winged helix-turn-helix transcriptional regulator [Chloroflexota bacterium]